MPELDVDRVIDLLDIVHKTIHLPNLIAINREAIAELLKVNKEFEEAQLEDKKKAEEEAAMKEAEEKKEKEYA
jgi:hypothetical protein